MNAEEPPPLHQPHRVAVWEMVIADIESCFGYHVNVAAIIGDMRERDQIGREKYGTALTAGNGRNHLVDAYQEALDLSVYLRAWVEEHRTGELITDSSNDVVSVYALYIHTLGTVLRLRGLVGGTNA